MSIWDIDNYTDFASDAVDAASDAVDAIRDAGDEIGAALKFVAPFVGMVPGLGTAFSVALTAAGAFAAGDKITDALIASASAAIPVGCPRIAFDGATNITKDVAEGRSVLDSTMNACREAANTAGGGAAVAAFDSGISMMKGGTIDQHLIDQLRNHYLQGGGQMAASSFDAGVSILQGNGADQVVIDVARGYAKQISPIALAAFDTGIALGHGKTLQEAGYIGLHTLVRGNDKLEKTVNFLEQVGRAKNLKIALHQLLESDLADDFLHESSEIVDSSVIDSTLGPYIDDFLDNPSLLDLPSGDLAKQWNEGEAIIRQAQALTRSGDGTIDDAMLTNLKTRAHQKWMEKAAARMFTTEVKLSTPTSSRTAGRVFTSTEVKASSPTSSMRAAPVDPLAGIVLTAVISSTVSPRLQVAAQGIIYALMDNGDLLWYRHDGRGDGSFVWGPGAGRRVGNGWNVKQAFSGGDGVIYALIDNGDLLWFRHDGRGDGSFVWAPGAGRRVGNIGPSSSSSSDGWNVKQAFSGGDGVIYALMDNGDLLWNRHDGRGDGSFVWAFDEGRKVGHSRDVKQAFSGGDGVIYFLMDNGDLLWNCHDGRDNGSVVWASYDGRKVGNGWDVKVKQAFSSGEGVIYALMDNGDLLWNRHDGRGDGSSVWASDQGRRVGNGWNVKQVFSG